jgi:hypothetical protein
MSRRSRVGTIVAALAITAALSLPASSALAGGAQMSSAGGGPVAQKSGVLINFVTKGKLRVAKTIQPLAACTAACTASGVGAIKGFGGKGSFSASGGPFQPGVPFGLFFKPNKTLLRAMKLFPGRFHLTETLTATPVDPATGAPTGPAETISATFGFKR